MSYKLQVTSYTLHVTRDNRDNRDKSRLSRLSRVTYFCFSALLLFCFLPLSAQKSNTKAPEHKIVFNIKDCKSKQMLLAIQFREKLLLRDSAFNNGKGSFVFEGTGRYDDGMYTLVSADTRKPMLNFIMDGGQNFTYHIDTTGNMMNFSVTGSPENAEMLRFLQKNIGAQRKMAEWGKKRKEFEDKGIKDSVEYYYEKMSDLNAEMEQFIPEFIAKNPDFLFSKLQKSYQEIKIPDPPVLADGSIDSTFQAFYYRTHYWDNFDLADRRFLHLPSFESKFNNYIKKVLWFHEADTLNKYMDMMLEKAHPDSLMYRFMVEQFTKEFEAPSMIGYDAVFVHFAKNNPIAGKCSWMDEDFVKKYAMRVEQLEPMLIGKKTVEMVLADTSQKKFYSSYDMPKKYRILWFYDHTCPTCKKEAKEIKAVYDSLENIGQRNFDVYAVIKTEDFAGWKKYIRENGYTWINVGGISGNVDWTKAYHINTNPQFYIINQNKEIILNRIIPKHLIPQFLMDYERKEAEKEQLKNNKR